MYNLENPQIRNYSNIVELTDSSYKFIPEKTGFMLAFGLADKVNIPASIGYFKAQYTTYTNTKDQQGNIKKVKKQQALDFEKCKAEDWPIDKQNLNLLDNISNLNCIKSSEWSKV